MRAVLQHQHLHTHLSSVQSTAITMLAPAHSWASSSSMGDSPRERVNGREICPSPLASGCQQVWASLGWRSHPSLIITSHHITSLLHIL